MHCNHFPSHIYVEKISEQWYFHKELEEVADRIDTKVKSQMNDKCKVKMIWKELYNIKNPS